MERGQALPLLALAVIGLAAFAALALDGGNLWTEQRRAQAAADNAVMAAAFQAMNGVTNTVTLNAAAQANALRNGYDNSLAPNTKVVFLMPPLDGPYAGNSQYLEVVITQTVPTALAHLIYKQDPIPVTVIAVAHGFPTGPILSGFAIAAMKPTCDGQSQIGLDADGGGRTGGTFLTDGGAFANSTCPDALNSNGNHDGIITNGPPISVVGGVSQPYSVCTAQGALDPTSNCNFYPAPTTGVPQVPQSPLAGTPAATPPDCSQLPVVNNLPGGNPVHVGPGQYTSLDSGNKDLILDPGIYCLTGGLLSSKGNITGQGVLIYLVDQAAKVDFSGGSSLDLEAAKVGDANGCTGNADPNHLICPYLGIVIYKVTGANTCIDNVQNRDVDFTGSAAMTVIGLVYAPFSLVRYGGTGSLTMTGQTIAGCVKFNGNGNINIIYNPNLTYTPPPSVRLDQ
jgi:hypothetical protein